MTYFINEEEKCIVNAKNGKIVRPACYDDLVLYYKYILGSDGEKAASQVLKRVVHGEKVISDMVAYMQNNGENK